MTKGQKAAARHAQNNAKNALKRIRRRERMRREDPGAAVAPRHRRTTSTWTSWAAFRWRTLPASGRWHTSGPS